MDVVWLFIDKIIELKNSVVKHYEDDKRRAEESMLQVVWYRNWIEEENERLFRFAQRDPTPPPISTSRLPDEPIAGNGSCVICREATAEMLMLGPGGTPSCRHTCMCEYCIHQLKSATCPMCREPFTSSVKLFRPEV